MARRIPKENLLEFYELPVFSRRWDTLGLPDEELGHVQLQIMSDPTAHPVIKGTTGIRKMRYSPLTWKIGKSGALRVCYVYFESLKVVVLVVVFAKSEVDDIPKRLIEFLNEQTRAVKVALQALQKGKAKHHG